jgi:hypothetical protein
MMGKTKTVLILLVMLSFISTVTFVFAADKSNSNSQDTLLDTSPTTTSDPCKGGGLGDGILLVFSDPQRTTMAPTDVADKYQVIFNRLYYFNITSISEYSTGQDINVWACHEDQTDLIGNYAVASGGNVAFTWTIPTLPDCSEVKYKYGLSLNGPNPSWRFAKRTTHGVGMTFAIPDVPLGMLGSTSTFFAAYLIRNISTKRKRSR